MKDLKKYIPFVWKPEIPYKRLKDKSFPKSVFPKAGETYKKYTQPDYKGKGQRGKGRKRGRKQKGSGKSIKRRRKR